MRFLKWWWNGYWSGNDPSFKASLRRLGFTALGMVIINVVALTLGIIAQLIISVVNLF